MKDYYKILGVEEGASEKEIQARCAELVEHYHRDLGKTKEADEEIKEIEEACEILGNEISRCGYDLERGLEGDLKRSYIKRAHRRKERKINIRKIMLSAGILFFSFIVGLIIFRWAHVAINPKSKPRYRIDKILEKKTASQIPPAKIESKLIEEREIPKQVKKKEVMPQESKQIVSVSPQRSLSRVESESKKKEESAPKMLAKSEMPVKVEEEVLANKEPEPIKELAPQVATKSEVPAVKQVSKEAPEEVPREVQKEVAGATLHPGEKLTITAKEEEKVPKEIRKVIPQESTRMDKPGPAAIEPQSVQKQEPSVKAGKVVSLPPLPLAKEEEVKRFFSRYIDRYNQKDIDGFLSFFSSKAVQNQKDGVKGIRNIYTEFFGESQELRYQVEGMEIEVYQNAVEVKARFRVDQRLKKPREEKTWKGNVRWVLVREDGVLKISSLDYQNEKSP